MPGPIGFAFVVRKNGDVEITHDGRPASVLRNREEPRFLVDVEDDDPQELMARLTGNYRRGNERVASQHPRNRRP